MIQLARDQTLVVAESILIRVLSVQLDTIRLSVSTRPNIQIVSCQTDHDVTVRVTLAAIHENTAGLEVDAPDTSIEQSCDDLDDRDQLQTTWNIAFCTLHVGECVAFAESSQPAAKPTESE